MPLPTKVLVLDQSFALWADDRSRANRLPTAMTVESSFFPVDGLLFNGTRFEKRYGVVYAGTRIPAPRLVPFFEALEALSTHDSNLFLRIGADVDMTVAPTYIMK